MGAYDLILHAAQSEQISELEERVKNIQDHNDIFYYWLQYFSKQLGEEIDSTSEKL